LNFPWKSYYQKEGLLLSSSGYFVGYEIELKFRDVTAFAVGLSISKNYT
jgi:hypothetical protein